jgi:hypothetical protein
LPTPDEPDDARDHNDDRDDHCGDPFWCEDREQVEVAGKVRGEEIRS